MSLGPDLYDTVPAVDAQERLNSIVDACGIGLWLSSPQLGQLKWNEHIKSHLHLPPDAQVDTELFYSCLHPDDREPVRQAIREAIEQRRGYDKVYRTVSSSGATKWIRAVGRPVFDSHGRPLTFDSITIDLTQQMSAQWLLRESEAGALLMRESEAQMRGFADTAPAILWATEPDGYCSFLSQGWYRYTGQQETEALGLGWLEAVHPNDRGPASQSFLQATQLRQPFISEHRLRRSDGQWRWIVCMGQPRVGPSASFQGFVGSVTDIHERKLAEQRLRESEERYRSFVASSTEGIWRVEFDPPVDTTLSASGQVEQIYRQGRFAECNDAFAHMYGFSSADQLLGHNLGLMLPPHDPASRAYLEGLIGQGYRGGEAEAREYHRNGRTFYFANSFCGVVEDGHLVRAWGTQRDVTDRKRIESALLEADRRKDDFLATLAHELRNPLAPIRNAVELLHRRGHDETLLTAQRDMIGRQVSQLARLIDDLLDISRITRDKLDLRKTQIELGELLRTTAENCRSEAEARRHTLRLDLPAASVLVEGDPVRLLQVVTNLLNNAAKYSPDGSPIWLQAYPDGNEAVICVRDQGMGIAAEHLPHVFDMFYQVEQGLNRSNGGLGIGLSLVQRLAQLHGGSVRAISPGIGQGSQFEVRLPLLHPVPSQAGAAAGPGLLPASVEAGVTRTVGALRVLVIDDNRDAADTLAEVLRMMGCRIETAYDGVEGLEKAEQLRPDVIILDLGMPRLNGYEACRHIRAQPWGRDIRLIAVSGWGQQDDLRRSGEAGFDVHLVKPVALDELMALMTPQS